MSPIDAEATCAVVSAIFSQLGIPTGDTLENRARALLARQQAVGGQILPDDGTYEMRLEFTTTLDDREIEDLLHACVNANLLIVNDPTDGLDPFARVRRKASGTWVYIGLRFLENDTLIPAMERLVQCFADTLGRPQTITYSGRYVRSLSIGAASANARLEF